MDNNEQDQNLNSENQSTDGNDGTGGQDPTLSHPVVDSSNFNQDYTVPSESTEVFSSSLSAGQNPESAGNAPHSDDSPTEQSPPKPFPVSDYPLSDSGNGTPLSSGNVKKVRKPRKPLSTLAKTVLIAAVVSLILGGASGAVVAKLTTNGTTSPVTTSAFSKNTSVIATPGDIQSILAKVEPAVVDIKTSGTVTQGGFFGGSSSFQAAGTGMIISSNGEVLTNNHVIANATSIKVQLFNQTKSYNATVVGADPSHDIAVIKIQGASNLPTVTFGRSSALQVGDSVIAVGNALDLQGSPTVTQGIVSALHRSITTSPDGTGTSSTTLNDMIQTDAPINPGNSGGPLVNSQGQVIGMNTAIISGTGSQPAQNIGFAEAIDSVVPVVKQIEAHPGSSSGGIITSGKAYMGVSIETLTSQIASQLGLPTNLHGVLVASVIPGSPANSAGITAGSVITKVDSTTVTTATQLVSLIQKKSPGSKVTVYWTNSNGNGSAVVTLGSAPTA